METRVNANKIGKGNNIGKGINIKFLFWVGKNQKHAYKIEDNLMLYVKQLYVKRSKHFNGCYAEHEPAV